MLAVFLTLAMPQGGCIVYPGRFTEKTEARPWQRSGEGLWIGGIAFAAEDIKSAEAAVEPITEGWSLLIEFTESGNAKFLKAQRCGIGHQIEISLDRKVLSRPMLHERILGGKATISGAWQNREEVQATANRIANR